MLFTLYSEIKLIFIDPKPVGINKNYQINELCYFMDIVTDTNYVINMVTNIELASTCEFMLFFLVHV
jgi:hypothetical protein